MSPPEFRKNLSSSSSGSCDVHHVESVTSLPPVVVKRTVSFVKLESENREIEKGVTSADENEIEEKRLVIEKGKTVISPGSEGDFEEANERLMTTPPGGGSTSMFHDIAMHELGEHQEEVPNTPVESNEKMRPVQNLNILNIYELDRETSSSRNSSCSPDFNSMPSSDGSHVDLQTMHEVTDEIKEMDKGVSSSSDLDSIGDFSVTQCGSSAEFENQVIDSVTREMLTWMKQNMRGRD
ncbi:hypothetical protein CASFOL_027038 [Castilleja foliolosa]|uniref:Uncharacterized protein n=1 Tax=Castilleja foliolosa TaxID=1961234 RepID=A0ABD3CLK2_9LAMI